MILLAEEPLDVGIRNSTTSWRCGGILSIPPNAQTLDHTCKENGHSKIKWLWKSGWLSQKGHRSRFKSDSGPTSYCLSRSCVFNFKLTRSQKWNACLGIHCGNHTTWNHGTIFPLNLIESHKRVIINGFKSPYLTCQRSLSSTPLLKFRTWTWSSSSWLENQSLGHLHTPLWIKLET